MKKTGLTVIILVGLLVSFLLIKTFTFRSHQISEEAIKPFNFDAETAIQHLSQAIQFQTTSPQNPEDFKEEPFLQFHRFLEKSYPAFHQTANREIINQYSLLFKWQGSDPSLEPVILLAHFDAVPIEPGTEADWSYDPYSGIVTEGYIWGRGTMDMKGSLIGLMESAENLIKLGFKPNRTLYFALGHDEELGGVDGGAKIAEHLKKQGVKAEYTLDEGLAVVDGAISPTGKQLALIGIAEKGYVTLKLSVTTKAGHSSMPPLKTTLGVLSRALVSLEENQMPKSFQGVAGLMFDHVGPEMTLANKAMFANRWLFGGLLLNELEKTESTNAMIRTTTAPTLMEGGVKENVLPMHATAYVNFRIVPGDSVSKVVEHAKKVIDNPNVKISVFGREIREPSPVSSIDSEGYQTVRQVVTNLFPDAAVVPALILGGTDSKHYAEITKNSYRFLPIVYGAVDPQRLHGIDERISEAGFIHSIQFYMQLISKVGEKNGG